MAARWRAAAAAAAARVVAAAAASGVRWPPSALHAAAAGAAAAAAVVLASVTAQPAVVCASGPSTGSDEYDDDDDTGGGGGLRELAVIGGHAGILMAGDKVYKPLQSGGRGHKEAAFYLNACPPPGMGGAAAHHALCAHMPAFDGFAVRVPGRGGDGGGGDATMEAVPPPLPPATPSGVAGHGAGAHAHHASHEQLYLVLENVAAGLGPRPSQMDIKMGCQSWDEDAPPDKVAKERDKYPPQLVMGFRCTGMRVWQPAAGRYKEHGRTFGYRLDESTMVAAFYEFLHDGTRLRLDLIPPLLTAMRSVRATMAAQHDYRFYGSSLLFSYAGTPTSGTPRVDVRMIDFAHVWPITDAGGSDTGYLRGVDSIIGFLEALGGAEGATVAEAAAAAAAAAATVVADAAAT